MKHSARDWNLVLIALLQVLLLVLPFVVSIPVVGLVLLALLNVYLTGMNYQCVAHSFIHHPFFVSSFLNRSFSILNSIAIGLPQSAYRLHHLNHHRYNNHPDKDESSTWRHGKNGREEGVVAYSLLGLPRTDVPALVRAAAAKGKLVWVELLVLVGFLLILGFLNPVLALAYVLPSLVGGQFFALWENYCEHHHADPNDRLRDSVSCYGTLYNKLWFNNGFHQEHHLRPQVHWTQIASVKAELPTDRVIVRGCHLTNSF